MSKLRELIIAGKEEEIISLLTNVGHGSYDPKDLTEDLLSLALKTLKGPNAIAAIREIMGAVIAANVTVSQNTTTIINKHSKGTFLLTYLFMYNKLNAAINAGIQDSQNQDVTIVVEILQSQKIFIPNILILKAIKNLKRTEGIIALVNAHITSRDKISDKVLEAIKLQSNEILENAILNSDSKQIIAICELFQGNKIPIPEKFIRLTVNSPRLDARAILKVMENVIASENEISEEILGALLIAISKQSEQDTFIKPANKEKAIQPIIDILASSNKLTTRSLESVILASQKKPGLMVYIPIIYNKLKSLDIAVPNPSDLIKIILENKLSHNAPNQLPSSTQIVVGLINAIVADKQIVAEETLIAVLTHPDKAALLQPVIEAVIKTNGFLNKSLRAVIRGLIAAGKEQAVISSLTNSLFSIETLDSEQLTESLMVLAIEKLTGAVIQEFMIAVAINENVKITKRIYESLTQNYGNGIDLIKPSIIRLVELKAAILEANVKDIFKICKELRSHKIPVPEKLVLKAMVQFETNSQEIREIIKTFIVTNKFVNPSKESLEIINTFVTFSGEISRFEIFDAITIALEQAIATADKPRIIKICDLLQRNNVFSLPEKFVQQAIQPLTDGKFNDLGIVRKIIETVIMTGSDITEQTLLIAFNQSSNRSFVLLDLILPHTKELSINALKVAIDKQNEHYINAICNRKLVSNKTPITEDYIQLAIKLPRLNHNAILNIVKAVIETENAVTEKTLKVLLTEVIKQADISHSKDNLVIELPNKAELIKPIIDAIVISKKLTTECLRAIILAYAEKSELGIYIPVICAELKKHKISISEDSILTILEIKKSHSEIGLLPRSSQIIIDLIQDVVVSGQNVSEKTLITAMKHPDKVILLPAVVDVIIKTGSSLSKNTLAMVIAELRYFGLEKEVIRFLAEVSSFDSEKLTESLIVLAIEKLKGPALQEFMGDIAISADIKITGKIYDALSYNSGLGTDLIAPPMIRNIELFKELNTAILQAQSEDIFFICKELQKRDVIVPEKLILKGLNKFKESSKEIKELEKTKDIAILKYTFVTAVKTLKDAIDIADEINIIKSCDKLQKNKFAPLSEEFIQQAIQPLKSNKHNTLAAIKKIIETVCVTGGIVTEQTLLTAINQNVNWAYLLLDLILPHIKGLSTHSLKVAIEKGNDDYVIAVCEKLKADKILVTADFIVLALKSAELQLPAIKAVIDVVLAANAKFNIEILQVVILAYQEKPELGGYIPLICSKLKKQGIVISEELILFFLQKKISHNAISHSPISSQIVIDLINTAIADKQIITEEVLMAVLKHPDKAVLLRPVIDAVVKTKGFINKSLRVTITELINAGCKEEEIVSTLTSSLNSSQTLDYEKSTESLVLLAIGKLKDPQAMQAFMGVVITADVIITDNIYAALPTNTSLKFNIKQLVALNSAVQESNEQAIFETCRVLQANKIYIPEKLVLKAASKFEKSSQENIVILNAFMAASGKISQSEVYEAVIVALENAIGSGNIDNIKFICDALKRQNKFPVSDKWLQQTFLKLPRQRFNSELFKQIIDAIIATGGKITEETALIVINESSAVLNLILPHIEKLSVNSLAKAIEKNNDGYVNVICQRLKDGQVSVTEDLLQQAINSPKLGTTAIIDVLNTTAAFNSVSLKTLQTLLAIVHQLPDREKLIEPIISAMVISKEITINALHEIISAYGKKTELGKYILIICNALQKYNIPISETSLILVLELKHSNSSSEDFTNIVIEMMNMVVASKQPISEKTLIVIINQASAANRKKLKHPVLDAILATKGVFTIASLQAAIEKGDHEYISAICDMLKAQNISVKEDSIQLAIQQMLKPGLEKEKSLYGGMSSNIKKDKEVILKSIGVIIDTVVASKASISEKTLQILMEHGIDIGLSQVNQVSKKTEGELSAKGVETVAPKVPKESDILLRPETLQPLTEELILQALNNSKMNNKNVLAVIDTVVKSGGKVSQKTLLAVVNKSTIRDVNELIDPVVRVMQKPDNTVFFESLKAAILNGNKELVVKICDVLKENKTLVSDAIIKFVITTYTSKETATEKARGIINEKLLSSLIEVVGTISEDALIQALKNPMNLTLVNPIINATGANISSKVLKTALSVNYWINREVVSSIAKLLKQNKVNVTEDLIVEAIKKLTTASTVDKESETAINDVMDAVRESGNNITHRSLQAVFETRNKKFVTQFCTQLEKLQIVVSDEIVKSGIEAYRSKSGSDREEIGSMLEDIFKRVGKVSGKVLKEALTSSLKLRQVQSLINICDEFSSDILNTALTTTTSYEKPQFIVSICDTLSKQSKVPSINEDLILKALTTLTSSIRTNSSSVDKELVENAIKQLINTVIASGNKVTESTLIAMVKMQPQPAEAKTYAGHMIAAIIATSGIISKKTLDVIFSFKAAIAYADEIFHGYLKTGGELTDEIKKSAIASKIDWEKIARAVAKEKNIADPKSMHSTQQNFFNPASAKPTQVNTQTPMLKSTTPVEDVSTSNLTK